MEQKLPDIEWLEIQDKVREILGLGMTVSQVMGLLESAKEALEWQKRKG